MTNAIIDNSTLTAVQRVIGHIPIERDYDLSGDLAAFDNYLATMLLYDEPSRVDDYKPEHSDRRAAEFAEIGAIGLDQPSYDILIDQAKALTAGSFLKIHGGDLVDGQISDFLRDLDLFVCPAWQMQSSDFYLRIQLLSDGSAGHEKYTPLMSAIFDQLSEGNRVGAKPNWRSELKASSGEVIKSSDGPKGSARKIGSDLKAFAASLNWLALRSTFYALLSEHLSATAVVHPIRSDYLAQFYSKKLNHSRPDQRAAVLRYFKATALDIVEGSNGILDGAAIKIQAPLISAWAASVAGGPRKARAHILETRYSPEAISLRARMRDIEDVHQEGNADYARQLSARLFRDFQNAVNAYFRKYGRGQDDPFGTSVNLISMSGSFKILPLLDKIKSLLPQRRKSVALLRNITLDLLQSPRLGKIADVLRSDAQYLDEQRAAYNPRIENPRFRYARYSWKHPM